METISTDNPIATTVVVTEPTDEAKKHNVLVHLLIVLAAVILLVTAVNVWVNRAALNTDNWVDASDQLLADTTVREAISVYVVDELYANVDVSGELQALLPADLSGLSGPLAAALQGPATDAVDRLLSTQAVAEIWSKVNRVAHETIVAILEDDLNPALSTADGTVTLDLREVVVQLGETLGLPGTVIDKIPEDVGQVTVVESSTLDDLQNVVKVIRWASALLFILVLGIYVGAVALAEGWRRVATRNAGISITIVGLLVLAGLRFGGDALVNTVVKDPSNEGVVRAVWTIGSSLLKDIGWNITMVGIVLILGAALAGTTRAARATRRFIAPAFVGGAGLRWGVGAAIFLILVSWAPIPALTNWFGILVFAAILAACIEGLRGLCLADRAAATAIDADTAVDAGDDVADKTDATPHDEVASATS
jgi:hypothetical protein